MYGLYVPLTTILRNRHQLGWVYRGSAYCQLIRQANKQKRLDWVRTYLHDSFDDIIWSDETTVQLESHRRFSYRKEGEKLRPKPRAKRPVKVHLWAGISKKGPTAVCIFDGIMDAPLYCEILERTLLTFIQETFPPPSTHWFMQDNDPKHCSRAAWGFYGRVGINWWCTGGALLRSHQTAIPLKTFGMNWKSTCGGRSSQGTNKRLLLELTNFGLLLTLANAADISNT